MNIVHVSASDVGGAGSAAIRLHKGLLNQRINSKFLCLNKNSFEEEVYLLNEKSTLNIFKRGIQKLGFSMTKKISNRQSLKRYVGDYEIFTFPGTDFNILTASIVKQADIINLHWVADFLDYPSFFKEINKPVVWTLHDKNPTLGGFHLLLDKEKNPSFFNLESKLAENKYDSINQVSNLNIISPSKFLFNYSKASKNLGKFKHHFIPNAIDITVFKPHKQQFAREVFNFPSHKKIILFLDSTSYHKGTDLVVECISNYKYNDIQFVALGSGYTLQHPGVINIEQIADERLMAILYSAADVFLLPSREDNLPNMMLESLACGTPVIGFPTGGINDVIKNGFNGFITEELTADSLNIGITKYLCNNQSFDRNIIRDFAVKHFDISVQAKKYIALYDTILKK